MVDSIKEYGVMTPAIVRPRKDGGYSLHASPLAGMAAAVACYNFIPAILPSEKAKAYEMKLQAIKRKGGRPSKINSGQVGPNFDERRSNQIVADEAGESVKKSSASSV